MDTGGAPPPSRLSIRDQSQHLDQWKNRHRQKTTELQKQHRHEQIQRKRRFFEPQAPTAATSVAMMMIMTSPVVQDDPNHERLQHIQTRLQYYTALDIEHEACQFLSAKQDDEDSLLATLTSLRHLVSSATTDPAFEALEELQMHVHVIALWQHHQSFFKCHLLYLLELLWSLTNLCASPSVDLHGDRLSWVSSLVMGVLDIHDYRNDIDICADALMMNLADQVRTQACRFMGNVMAGLLVRSCSTHHQVIRECLSSCIQLLFSTSCVSTAEAAAWTLSQCFTLLARSTALSNTRSSDSPTGESWQTFIQADWLVDSYVHVATQVQSWGSLPFKRDWLDFSHEMLHLIRLLSSHFWNTNDDGFTRHWTCVRHDEKRAQFFQYLVLLLHRSSTTSSFSDVCHIVGTCWSNTARTSTGSSHRNNEHSAMDMEWERSCWTQVLEPRILANVPQEQAQALWMLSNFDHLDKVLDNDQVRKVLTVFLGSSNSDSQKESALVLVNWITSVCTATATGGAGATTTQPPIPDLVVDLVLLKDIVQTFLRILLSTSDSSLLIYLSLTVIEQLLSVSTGQSLLRAQDTSLKLQQFLLMTNHSSSSSSSHTRWATRLLSRSLA